MATVVGVYVFIINVLTPYVADDFTYMQSFATKNWIRSPLDIPASMVVHSTTMNGRFLSHGLDQFFMLFPKIIFDIFNTFVLIMLLFIMNMVVWDTKKLFMNEWLYLGIAAAFLVFTPAFGEVALWQTGSVNYLWALLFGLLFLRPYISCYLNGKDTLKDPSAWVHVCAFSFLMGMYTEVTSFICAAVAGLFTLAMCKEQGTLKNWRFLPILSAGAGYLVLMHIPAERAAKQGELTKEVLLERLTDCNDMFVKYGLVLLIAWGVCFLLGIVAGVDRKRILSSLFLVIGAVASNYMLLAAAYYPARCACTMVLLLILAVFMVGGPLVYTSFSGVLWVGGLLLTGVLVLTLFTGNVDIMESRWKFMQREHMIYNVTVESEDQVFPLPVIKGETKYSVFYDLKDMDTETAEAWPNMSMAAYYRVPGIIGVEEDWFSDTWDGVLQNYPYAKHEEADGAVEASGADGAATEEVDGAAPAEADGAAEALGADGAPSEEVDGAVGESGVDEAYETEAGQEG